ncbi:MAG: sterol desaturase family protein [Thermodesulfobacteriota bacterium]
MRRRILQLLGGATTRRGPLDRELPGWLTGLLIGGTLAATLWLERRRPLREGVERGPNHELRNLAMSALSATAIRLTEKPLTSRMTALVQERRWGLVKRANLPPALEVALAVLLLDYTLYVWHVLTHRVPFLWRFHRVHHADLDLTASTALRFHFAEMVLSVPWRVAQVLVVGAAPLSLAIWQTATLMAILFHHSNSRLPIALERRLSRLLMTPRMHGIHHSIVRQETDSNWSTIFAFPDYLHGTHRLNVPQDEVTIGVPELRDPGELGLGSILALPFAGQPASGLLLGDGTPERASLPALPASTLAA